MSAMTRLHSHYSLIVRSLLALSPLLTVPAAAPAAEKRVDLGYFLAKVRSSDGKTLELDVLVFEAYRDRKRLNSEYDLIEYGIKWQFKPQTVQVEKDKLKVGAAPVKAVTGAGGYRRTGGTKAATLDDVKEGEMITLRIHRDLRTGKLFTSEVKVHPVVSKPKRP